MNVAGTFVPAQGYVTLRGPGLAMNLCAEGRCTAHDIRTAWRVKALRGPWVGEFIEPSERS